MTPVADRQPCAGPRQATGQAEGPQSMPQGPLDSAALLRGGRTVEIRHNGEVYRLQSTRLGKLILTK